MSDSSLEVPNSSALQSTCNQLATDCISRQAAIDVIMGQPPEPHYPSWYAEQIKALPSAQPGRKTGKWILSDDQDLEDTRNGNYRFICSNCLSSDIHVKTTEVPFCWHCGADMMEETGGAK